MKYSTDIKIFEKVYSSMIKKEIKDKKVLCKIEEEYKKIMIRAKDIGKNNMLLSSYSLAAFFIAMNRTTKLNPEENYNILKKGLEKSKLLKVFLGNEKSYFSKKKMEKRRKWSKQTYERNSNKINLHKMWKRKNRIKKDKASVGGVLQTFFLYKFQNI